MKAGSVGHYTAQLWAPTKQVFAQLSEAPVIKLLLATLVALHDTFIQEHTEGVLALVLLVVLDQASGVMCAVKKKQFTSHKFRNGLVKLFTYMVLISALHVTGEVSGVEALSGLDKLAIAWLIVTETLSIAENFQCATGIRIPTWLRQVLSREGK